MGGHRAQVRRPNYAARVAAAKLVVVFFILDFSVCPNLTRQISHIWHSRKNTFLRQMEHSTRSTYASHHVTRVATSILSDALQKATSTTVAVLKHNSLGHEVNGYLWRGSVVVFFMCIDVKTVIHEEKQICAWSRGEPGARMESWSLG